jgi:hypothetical protein
VAVRLVLRLQGGSEPPQAEVVRAVLDSYGAVLVELTSDELLLSLSPSTDLRRLAASVVSALGSDSALWITPAGSDPRGAAGAGYSCVECGGVDSDHFTGCSRDNA